MWVLIHCTLAGELEWWKMLPCVTEPGCAQTWCQWRWGDDWMWEWCQKKRSKNERRNGGSWAEREVLRRQMSPGRGSKSSMQFSIGIWGRRWTWNGKKETWEAKGRIEAAGGEKVRNLVQPSRSWWMCPVWEKLCPIQDNKLPTCVFACKAHLHKQRRYIRVPWEHRDTK